MRQALYIPARREGSSVQYEVQLHLRTRLLRPLIEMPQAGRGHNAFVLRKLPQPHRAKEVLTSIITYMYLLYNPSHGNAYVDLSEVSESDTAERRCVRLDRELARTLSQHRIVNRDETASLASTTQDYQDGQVKEQPEA